MQHAKRLLNALFFVTLTGSISIQTATAQSTCPIVVSTDTALTVNDYGQASCNITINDGVSVSTSGGTAVAIFGNGSSLFNNGTISSFGAPWSIYSSPPSSGTSSINNTGIVSADSGAAIRNNRGQLSLINSGTITSSGMYSFYNLATVSSFINSGNISNTNAAANAAIENAVISTFVSLENTSSGTISGSNGIWNRGLITTLNNSGSISGTRSGNAGGIYNGSNGRITSLINSGSISNPNGYGIYNNSNGIVGIETLTNTGTISGGLYGINNTDVGGINTLNNQQGASSSPLSLTGKLPLNYNIIIASTTDYGQLTVGSVNGVTNFGISTLSTTSTSIINTNFISVLTGITPEQLGHPGVTSFSSTSNGYSYTLSLSNIPSNTWGLIITACTPCSTSINSGMSVPLSAIGVSATPVLNGGTLVLNNNDNSSQAFTVLTASSILAPTEGVATLSGVFSGSAGLTISGSGTVVFSGINTYSGGTTVASGTLQGNTSSLQGNITNNGTVIFDQATDGTYSGVMSGTGALVKQNIGILTLSGSNTYSGGTTVNSGILSISGESPTGTGDVYIATGATLMGRGLILGRLYVAGTLKPGNSPGYLSASSTFTMNAGSTYLQDIAGTTQANSNSPIGASGYYSFLNVTNGQFVIQDDVTLTPRLANLFSVDQPGYGSATYVPRLGDRFRIVTAAEGITGRFTKLTQPEELSNGTQLLPFYNMAGSNSIDLTVTPTSYVETIDRVSGNANAQSVGSVLTKIGQSILNGTSTSTQDQLLYSISGQTTAEAIASFTQSLAGEVYAATVGVIAQTTQRLQQAVLSRLGDTAGLNMSTPISGSMVSLINNAGGVPSAAISSNPAVNPETDAKSFSNGNVWGDLAYQRGNRASDNQSGGWNSNLYQLTFGSDFYYSDSIMLGAGFALSNTTLTPVYGTATIQQAAVFAYGKIPVDDFVFDAMASIGLSSSDISRGDLTGLSTGYRNKSVSGNDALISLGLSRPFDMNTVRITPFARLTWQMVTQSAINEGSTASALSIDRFTGNGVRGMIGVAAGSKASNPMTEKHTYRSYIGVGVDSNGLLNPTLNASIAGLATNISTPHAGKTFLQAGLFGTTKLSDNTFGYLGINAELRDGQTLGSLNLGLRVQF
ncbi:autotransporter outer membrane beta-barrel domain-containing protein [Zwartia vadi]|uniref:autotransporter outer membrane beta-barrel domain-containing protein n=1 Tax=Zwartia vadi TaxID=3058168 RepID=UPI0025B31FFB|nr:autotransporter domain-containing protein [Zwartia vadi]